MGDNSEYGQMKIGMGACLLALGMVSSAHAMTVIVDDQITHRVVANGSWFNAATWDNGVPGAGDVAQVPIGFSVAYDGIAVTPVHAIRVDGSLRFATDVSSELLVDTLEVAMSGELSIGTLDDPVQPQAEVRIVFLSGSDIDIVRDPDLISRGLIAHGRVYIHGQRKTVHGKLAVDALQGQTTLQLAQAPEGWSAGDTLVLTGTRYSGWKWDNSIDAVRYHDTQDEVLTIASVSGSSVTVTEPLQYDHGSPRADLKASVANFTRNITFSTDNGAGVPLHRRGHVMLMHHTDFDVRFAAFEQLGRTDKEVESFDLDQIITLTPASNVRGRYPLHLHISGIDTPESPAMVVGNAVFNSPGWGYVHHASNAVFHDNASFDTHGAGFVAETGDEIGAWTDNIAIRAKGNSAFNPKNGVDVDTYDMARTGTGFWFQGRMVRSVGNIAASVNQGFVYLHRGTRMRGFPGSAFPMPEALRRTGLVSPDHPPILNFHDNEAFASAVGLYVVKANPNQGHDIHTHLSDFRAWEVTGGAAMEYTSHYLLEDFDIIGKTPEPFGNAAFGIEFGTNTSDMVVNRARIARVPQGIRLGKDFTDSFPPEINQYALIDVLFDNVALHYVDFDADLDLLLSAGDLVPGRFEIVLNDGQPLEYLSPATNAGVGIDFIGTKTESIGSGPLPPGTDWLGIESFNMIAICAQDGYLRSAEGHPFAIVEQYFSDRASGRIEKLGLVVRLGADVDAVLGNPFFAWRDAFERGPIDLDSAAPVAVDDAVTTAPATDVEIDVLANDSDPDGDPLVVDGFVPPRHGLVFVNASGGLTYRPDIDFVGVDRFRYWASDGQGNFSPATVTVTVASGYLFRNGFEAP